MMITVGSAAWIMTTGFWLNYLARQYLTKHSLPVVSSGPFFSGHILVSAEKRIVVVEAAKY